MSRLRSPLLWGGAILLTLVVVAALAPALAPYGHSELAGDSFQDPSGRHILGTNDIGQDIFSQVIWGTRTSLATAVPAATLSLALASLVGVVSGLRAGLFDLVVMRAVDVLLAVPALPVIVVVAALAGPSRTTLLLVIGFLTWPANARILRGQTLSLRHLGFVSASQGFGGGTWYLTRRHLVPALSPVMMASFLQMAAAAVFLESGLSFLGLSDPTTVSWGQVMRRAITSPGLFNTGLWAWWVLPVGLAITIALLGLTLVGVGLEPRMNRRAERF